MAIRVKMLVSVEGSAEPQWDLKVAYSFKVGQIVELHPDLAQSWIAGGRAVLIKEIETAAIKPQTERATLPLASPKHPRRKS